MLYKAKTHQNRFWLGLRPRPRWGNLQRSPRPSSWILRALLLRKGRGGEGKGRKRVRREEKEGKGDLPYDVGDLEMTWLP